MVKKRRYIPIKGDSARRLKDRYTGKIISRRFYDEKIRRVVRSVGKPLTKYKKLRESYMLKNNITSIKQARNSEELKQIVKDLRRAKYYKKRGNEKKYQELAKKALKLVGRREFIPDDVDVGDSSKYVNSVG